MSAHLRCLPPAALALVLAACGQPEKPADRLMPEVGGEVSFTALGGEAGESWAGALTVMQFVEVEIDSDTLQTQPVSDGLTIALDAWRFDVVLGGAR